MSWWKWKDGDHYEPDQRSTSRLARVTPFGRESQRHVRVESFRVARAQRRFLSQVEIMVHQWRVGVTKAPGSANPLPTHRRLARLAEHPAPA
jgi:hypothetical protein